MKKIRFFLVVTAMLLVCGGVCSLDAQVKMSVQEREKAVLKADEAVSKADELLKVTEADLGKLLSLFENQGSGYRYKKSKQNPYFRLARNKPPQVIALFSKIDCDEQTFNFRLNWSPYARFGSIGVRIGDYSQHFVANSGFSFEGKDVERLFRMIAMNPDKDVFITLFDNKGKEKNNVSFVVPREMEFSDEVSKLVELADTMKKQKIATENYKIALTYRYSIPALLSERFFSESQLQSYKKLGKSVIMGQAFLKTQGGDVKLGAGCEVVLFPATEYMIAYYSHNLEVEKKTEMAKELNSLANEAWAIAQRGVPSTGTLDAQILQIRINHSRVLELLNKHELVQAMTEKEELLDERMKLYRKTIIADANGSFEFRDLPPGKFIIACNITWKAGNETTGGTVFQIVEVGGNETKKVVLTR